MKRNKKGQFTKGLKPWNAGKRTKIKCPICGTMFNKWDEKQNKRKTCSKECRIEAIKRARANQVITKKTKEKIGKALRGKKPINGKETALNTKVYTSG